LLSVFFWLIDKIDVALLKQTVQINLVIHKGMHSTIQFHSSRPHNPEENDSLSKHDGRRRKKTCKCQTDTCVAKRAVQNHLNHSLIPQNHLAIARQIVIH
jgi:hypothetical protein